MSNVVNKVLDDVRKLSTGVREVSGRRQMLKVVYVARKVSDGVRKVINGVTWLQEVVT